MMYREQMTKINANRAQLVVFEDRVRAATTAAFSVSAAALVIISSRWLIRKLR